MIAPIDIFIGNKLRVTRKLHGMTQAELAKQLGISFQQVQKYERGHTRISASRLAAISALFGVSLQYWLEDRDKPAGEQEPPPEAVGGRMALSLLQAFHRIENREHQQLLCSLARALGGQTAESPSEAVA